MMSRQRSKTCPGCKKIIKGGNEQLVSHMLKYARCRSRIKYCVGCNKPCADLIHLKNHQTQQQKRFNNTFCIQGIEKLERAQILNVNNDIIQNNLTSGTKRKIHSVEQPIALVFNSDNSKKLRIEKEFDLTTSVTKPKPHRNNTFNFSSQSTHQQLYDIDDNSSFIGVTTTGNAYVNRNSFVSNDFHQTFELDDNMIQNNDSFSLDSQSETYETTVDSLITDLNDTHISTSTRQNRKESNNSLNCMSQNTTNNNLSLICDHSTTNNVHSTYIHNNVMFIQRHRKKSHFSFFEKALIDLYHVHRRCSAPTYLFDETFNWLDKHINRIVHQSNHVSSQHKAILSHQVPSRKTFVLQMYEKLYSKERMHMFLPREINVQIDESNFINMTIFQFGEVIIDMLSNDDIMNPHNLLFYDDNDPTKNSPKRL